MSLELLVIIWAIGSMLLLLAWRPLNILKVLIIGLVVYFTIPEPQIKLVEAAKPTITCTETK